MWNFLVPSLLSKCEEVVIGLYRPKTVENTLQNIDQHTEPTLFRWEQQPVNQVGS